MLLGVVALASGLKQAIEDTGRTLPAGPCWALGCGVGLYLAGNAAFRHALRIGPGRYRLTAAIVALAASWVGVALSVAAEMAVLTVIVAAALAVESRAAVDTVDACRSARRFSPSSQLSPAATASGMRVLILGGTLFIGRRIALELLARGDDVMVVHRGQTEPAELSGCAHG